jgi:hypothetical protein
MNRFTIFVTGPVVMMFLSKIGELKSIHSNQLSLTSPNGAIIDINGALEQSWGEVSDNRSL